MHITVWLLGFSMIIIFVLYFVGSRYNRFYSNCDSDRCWFNPANFSHEVRPYDRALDQVSCFKLSMDRRLPVGD